MAREIYGHMPILREYGDGFHEPRSESVYCECGAHIWDWMQFYEEVPDWEQNWLDHLTAVQHEIDPSPIYGEIGDGYESVYSLLNREFIHFGRIDCGIPGVRLEAGGIF